MSCCEISYDLVMTVDMSFVEGSFRLRGGNWQVFVFRRADVTQPQWRLCSWESGVTGIHVEFPRSEILNEGSVERLLSSALGVPTWSRVHGPDSMSLR